VSYDEVLRLKRSFRKRLIEQFEKSGDKEFLAAAAQLSTVTFGRASILTRLRRRGRPEVSGDHGRLFRMALLIDRGLAANPTEAARLVAQPDNMRLPSSIIRRLGNKFTEHRPVLHGTRRRAPRIGEADA
jgi:hypothetical protein